jgi:hypothetical protein
MKDEIHHILLCNLVLVLPNNGLSNIQAQPEGPITEQEGNKQLVQRKASGPLTNRATFLNKHSSGTEIQDISNHKNA